MKELSNQSTPFDSTRQTDNNGREFWSARDLQKPLGYVEWRKFEDAIQRAQIACKNSGSEPSAHFGPAAKIVKAGATSKSIQDYHLTRYGCYLTAMNGDPRKPEIAAAQSYFAIKTREAELGIVQQVQELDPIETAKNPQLLRQAVEQLEDIALAAAKKAQLFKLLEQHYYPSQYRVRGKRKLPQAKPVIWNRMQLTQMTIIFEVA